MTDRLVRARRVLADWLVRAAARVDPDWYLRVTRVRLVAPGTPLEADIARRVREAGKRVTDG